MLRLQDSLFKMILDVESVNINMFHPVVINKIMSDANSRFVVAADVNWLDVRDLQFV